MQSGGRECWAATLQTLIIWNHNKRLHMYMFHELNHRTFIICLNAGYGFNTSTFDHSCVSTLTNQKFFMHDFSYECWNSIQDSGYLGIFGLLFRSYRLSDHLLFPFVAVYLEWEFLFLHIANFMVIFSLKDLSSEALTA